MVNSVLSTHHRAPECEVKARLRVYWNNAKVQGILVSSNRKFGGVLLIPMTSTLRDPCRFLPKKFPCFIINRIRIPSQFTRFRTEAFCSIFFHDLKNSHRGPSWNNPTTLHSFHHITQRLCSRLPPPPVCVERYDEKIRPIPGKNQEDAFQNCLPNFVRLVGNIECPQK